MFNPVTHANTPTDARETALVIPAHPRIVMTELPGTNNSRCPAIRVPTEAEKTPGFAIVTPVSTCGELLADTLNLLPTVTESPVPRTAEANVHNMVHAASAPILKVLAAAKHAYPPTLTRSVTVPADHPLQLPIESVFPVPAEKESGVPVTSVPKRELAVPAETI